MTLFQRLRNKVLISIRKKKYYYIHYKMWDYIITHLQSDSEDIINDAEYITKLKKIFLKSHHYNQVYLNCFLCDLYYGTQKESECIGCPLYNLYRVTCLSAVSSFHTVCNRRNERTTRIEAAKMIRDCVLRKGGKNNGI